MEEDKSHLAIELEKIKGAIFEGDKAKSEMESEKKLHKQKMMNLESEKQSLMSTLQRIREDANEKRKKLLEEQEKTNALSFKIEDMDKQRASYLRESKENKEIKNVMLQRIRGNQIEFHPNRVAISSKKSQR